MKKRFLFLFLIIGLLLGCPDGNKNSFEVTFDSNGGSGSMGALTVKEGESVKLSKNEFTRSGYSFLGWSKDKSATTATYSDEDSVENVSENLTLYAVWKKDEASPTVYNLSYSVNSDSATLKSGQVAFSEVVLTAGNTVTLPTKDEFEAKYDYVGAKIFRGWGSTSDATSFITEYAVGSDPEDVTVYAIFADSTVPTYKASFDANGGTGTMDDVTGNVEGSYYTLPACGFTAPDGKQFFSWNTADDGSGDYYGVGSPHSFRASDVTFYAIWEDVTTQTYKLSYSVDPLKATPKVVTDFFADVDLIDGHTITLPTKSEFEEKYDYVGSKTFNGWSLTENGALITEYPVNGEPTEDVTVYAVFSDVATPTYHLSYSVDPLKATLKVVDDFFEDVNLIDGSVITLPTKVQFEEKYNYVGSKTFDGWSLSENGALITEYTVSGVPTEDVTVYAVISDVATPTYKLSYSVSPLKAIPKVPADSFEDVELIDGNNITFPTKSEFEEKYSYIGSQIFDGWSLTENGTVISGYVVNGDPTEDVTIYAVFSDVVTPTYQLSYSVEPLKALQKVPGDSFADVELIDGNTITFPTKSEFEEKYNCLGNNVFDGWSLTDNGALITEYVVNGEPTENITIYAVFSEATQPSDFNITADDVMKYVPVPTLGIIFPRGESDDSTGTVLSSYYVAETETTFKLWAAVRDWAKNNGYSFANEGRQGGASNTGDDDIGDENNPVTKISWKDAVVWCNALTDYYNSNNGSDLSKVYYSDLLYQTAITDANSITKGSDVKTKLTADGFRLPSYEEWECAARWQGTTNVNDNYVNPNPSLCTNGYYWTKGNSASGAASSSATNDVAISSANCPSVGFFSKTYYTAQVKTKDANALGLCDMNGNVSEYLITLDGDNAYSVGGSFYDFSIDCHIHNSRLYGISDVYDTFISSSYSATTMGFRVVKNK